MPLGEKKLIQQIQRAARGGAAVVKGIGDDCAVLRVPGGHEVLITTDFSIEKVHFRRDWHPPEVVGWRCLTRGLSDIAAMGGEPLAAFLSLAVAGWDGYAQSLRQMTAVGELLRRELVAAGWKIANQTPLPVVCFTDGRSTRTDAAAYLERIAQEVVGSGEAWISTTRIGANQPVLRACITNFRTTQADIASLVRSLDKARARVGP